MRLRMVAPATAVNQSTDSISAYWPSRSVARSSAAAREAGSDPLELPADHPDNAATQVGAALHLKSFQARVAFRLLEIYNNPMILCHRVYRMTLRHLFFRG